MEDPYYRDGEHTEFYLDGSYQVIASIVAPGAPPDLAHRPKGLDAPCASTCWPDDGRSIHSKCDIA